MNILDKFSLHYDERPDGTIVDTVVVHSMCHPESPKPEDPHSCIERLADCKVSAHFLVDRTGGVWRLVPEDKRAWHAGESRMHDGREGVNHFSIGIELIAKEKSAFTEQQYDTIVALTGELVRKFPISFLVGHEDIAMPKGRKTDPGPKFDWEKLRDLIDADPMTAHITLPFKQL